MMCYKRVRVPASSVSVNPGISGTRFDTSYINTHHYNELSMLHYLFTPIRVTQSLLQYLTTLIELHTVN